MNRRLLLALCGLCALLLTAGCLGPSEIPDDQLQGNATYEWDTDADAAYTLSSSSYQAVFNASNRSTLSVHRRDALGIESPVEVSRLQYRFENETVVNATHPGLSATREQSQTAISLPAEDGRVAYTAPHNGKQFATPVIVAGTQTITLPPSTRVGVPILSQVSPGNYSTSVSDGLMTIRWGALEDGTLSVKYYLQRDLLLFGGLFAIAVLLGLGGFVYYFRQIRHLEAVRKEIGLDVEDETEDDDPRDRGPPPGMR